MYRNGIKRLLAVILSLGGMICLSPLLLVLCIAIKLDSPGPVFFKQKRVGIHKQHFNILKFRTMRIDTPHDMPTHLLHDPDQYITRVGPPAGPLEPVRPAGRAGQIRCQRCPPRPDGLGPDPWPR